MKPKPKPRPPTRCTICNAGLADDKHPGVAKHCTSPTCNWCMSCRQAKWRECKDQAET